MKRKAWVDMADSLEYILEEEGYDLQNGVEMDLFTAFAENDNLMFGFDLTSDDLDESEIEEVKELFSELTDAVRSMDFENSNIEGEWAIYEDEGQAEEAARERVREDLEDEPELFNQDWLKQFYILTDTDKRLLAQDLSSMSAEDLSDQEACEYVGMEAQYEEAELNGEDTTSLGDEAREKFEEQLYEDHLANLEDDPIHYLEFELGIYSDAVAESNLFMLDVDEAVDSAILNDGWLHFIGAYDDDYVETNAGYILVRRN